VTSKRDGRRRSSLDFVNPLDLLVDWIIWQIRWAGARVITGVVLIAALVVMTVGFIAPFVPAYALISVFGLTVEPYKWVGSVLIVVALIVGVVAVPLIFRRMLGRGQRILAYTMFGDDDPADPFATGPSPTVPTVRAGPTRPAGPTREQWAAGIRALDDRLKPPADAAEPPAR